MAAKIKGWEIPDYLLLGFAISSVAPLAFASISLASGPGSGIHNIPISLLIGIALFSTVILIWLRYSDKIASSGGLYSFVKAAAGENIAKAQGIIWIVSYFLYLPYTVAYIVFYILPSMFSIPTTYLYVLEVAIPVAISLLILSNRKAPFYFLFMMAGAELLMVLVISILIFGNNGLNLNSSVPNTSLKNLGQNGFSLALLFICADLPLFLGGEAKGKGRSIQKALIASFAIVAIFLFVFSIAISNIPETSGTYTIFGFEIAQQYGSTLFADIIGIFAVLSLIGLIIAEFMALGRLIHSMFNIKIERILIYISAVFIALDLVSLINPDDFYNYTILPSILALYTSQVLVFLVYPKFISKYRSISAVDVTITIVASLLMVYGIYGVVTGYSGYLLQ